MPKYLNIEMDYFDHRKTKRLISLLGRGADVLPIRLWIYCGRFHCEDGRLNGYSEREIESLVGWWGKSGAMLPAFETAGFLHCEGGTWEVQNWKDHQGHLPVFKERAKLAAKARWDRYREELEKKKAVHAPSNATSIAQAQVKQSSLPNCTVPIKPTAGASPPAGVEKKPKPPGPEPALKRQFTDAWMAAYLSYHGEKYLFQGAKDGTAADRLLKTGLPVEKVIEIARAAWSYPTGFNCKFATELSQFAGRFNAIRAEVKILKDGVGGPVSPVPAWRQIKSLEDEISKHPANRESRAHDVHCTPVQKEHLKTLRARLQALQSPQ